MIKGIYADEADQLHPDGHLKVRRATTHPCPQQWVNVYEIDVCGRATFYCSCQVKELDLDYPEEYGLEPTDEYGKKMSLFEAFSYVKVEDGVEQLGNVRGARKRY